MTRSSSIALETALTRLETAWAGIEQGVLQWQIRQNDATQAALARLDGVLGALEPLLEAKADA